MKTKDFLLNVKSGDPIIEKVKNLKTPEEVYSLLKGAGVTDTYEEFYKTFADMQSQYSKISESELNAIVGGCGDSATTATTATSVTAAAFIFPIT